MLFPGHIKEGKTDRMKEKELLILNQLINNSEYRDFVIHYLQADYFNSLQEKVLYECLSEYILKYKSSPSKEAFLIALKGKISSWDLETKEQLLAVIQNELFVSKIVDQTWLLDVTEDFCRTQAIYQGLVKCIEIHNGSNKKLNIDVIPDILREALNISFDSKIALCFDENLEDRYLFYTTAESGISSELDIIRKVTNGIGLPRKGLTMLMSDTHAGKTLCKCHIAASAYKQGYNVLYITLEMSRERIAQRIDCNLLDIEMDDLPNLTKEQYVKKMQHVLKHCKGKLYIEEFPTSLGHAGHFKRLIEDLKNKKGFIPDLLVVDYINICASKKYSGTNSLGGTYLPMKSVSEELRALGMEYNCAVLSSTQTNREGLGEFDKGLKSVAESMGVAHTSDIFWFLFRNEQLDNVNKLMITQLKNRLKDLSLQKRFLLGVNRPKMQLLNSEEDSLVEEYINKDKKEEHVAIDASHFKGRKQVSTDGFNF